MSTRLVSAPNGRSEVNIVGGFVAWFRACPEARLETGLEAGPGTESETGFGAGSETEFKAGFEAELEAKFEAGLEPCKKPSTKPDDGAEREVGIA